MTHDLSTLINLYNWWAKCLCVQTLLFKHQEITAGECYLSISFWLTNNWSNLINRLDSWPGRLTLMFCGKYIFFCHLWNAFWCPNNTILTSEWQMTARAWQMHETVSLFHKKCFFLSFHQKYQSDSTVASQIGVISGLNACSVSHYLNIWGTNDCRSLTNLCNWWPGRLILLLCGKCVILTSDWQEPHKSILRRFLFFPVIWASEWQMTGVASQIDETVVLTGWFCCSEGNVFDISKQVLWGNCFLFSCYLNIWVTNDWSSLTNPCDCCPDRLVLLLCGLGRLVVEEQGEAGGFLRCLFSPDRMEFWNDTN